MAMAKLGSGITEMNGALGGNVYRHDQCGQHVQSMPRHVSNEPSPNQKKRQRAWKTCINYIRTHSTVEFVHRWQICANDHPKTNKKGETITLSWWQMFMSINVVRVFNDLPILQYPPE